MLVLGSEGDRVLTGEASKKIVEITGAEIFMYDDNNPHAVYDEAPDLCEKVLDFYLK